MKLAVPTTHLTPQLYPQNLSESLSRRSGELIGDLRTAAAPLAAAADPAVAAELARELEQATAKYDDTRSQLTQLCDKLVFSIVNSVAQRTEVQPIQLGRVSDKH